MPRLFFYPHCSRILIAVVLPFCEFVEEGTVRRSVRGPLPLGGARCSNGVSFEASLSALITRVLWPLGLQVEALSRVPYLCRGDSRRPYYVLSDAVLLLRPTIRLGNMSALSSSSGGSRQPGLRGAQTETEVVLEQQLAVIRANLQLGGPLVAVDPFPVAGLRSLDVDVLTPGPMRGGFGE